MLKTNILHLYGVLPYLKKYFVSDSGYSTLQVDSQLSGELKRSVLAACVNQVLSSKVIVPYTSNESIW